MTVGGKWQLAVVNFGAPRHDGEELYMQNIYNVPAWVVLCCELHATAHERILHERDEWRPAESALHLQLLRRDSSQTGSCAVGRHAACTMDSP